MTILFYEYAPSPFCRSVKTVARILGVALESKVINIFNKEQFTPEYLKINPFHTIPAIDDDGFILTESRAIVAYLVDKYSPGHALYPKDLQKRAIIDQMLFFDSGTLSNSIVGFVRPKVFLKEEPSAESIAKLKEHLKMLDDILGKRKYVAADELSVADITIFAILNMAEVAGFDLSEFTNVSAWAENLRQELPDYKEINELPLMKLKESLKE